MERDIFSKKYVSCYTVDGTVEWRRNEMGKRTVAIVGAGKVGSALAIALEGAGYGVGAVTSRTQRSAQALADRLGAAVATDFAGAAAAAAARFSSSSAS